MTRDQQIAHLASEGFSAEDIDTILTQMPDLGEGFIDFDGCDDPMDQGCRGWDGVSRRCDCGNRRVCWTVEDGWAYGEAY